MTYSFYLKSWFLFLLCPLPSSKNPFNFFDGGGCVFVCVCVCVCVCWRGGGCSINSTARGKRGTMILDGIRQGGGGGSRKHNFEGDV